MSDLPYPDEPERTHWEGCYREAKHHNCAVVEVDTLRARLAEVEAALQGKFNNEWPMTDDVKTLQGMVAVAASAVTERDERLAEAKAENERLREALREPFLAVWLDGRNEWGTHVLELPASSLGHFHEDTVSDMEKNEDDIAERIMSDAEEVGYKACHAVVTRWRVDGVGDEAYMEYRGISIALTTAMFGTAEEQEAEHARAALAQPKEPEHD